MIPVRRLSELDDEVRDRLLIRGRTGDPAVERAVETIIQDVRDRGDDALLELARRFDGADLEALEVPKSAWDDALTGLDPAVRDALTAAAGTIRRFHEMQRPTATVWEARPGLVLGRRPDPLRRVGVYAPGGRAAYPSSLLMGVVPAKVAGVGQVVVCSPPGPDGRPSPVLMAACAIAGADRLFALGGAGAIAALALGTASVPRVDRVVGPGNAYVAAAKQRLASIVGIDSPAGPSELLVLADGGADPAVAAGEMIAQAEHDPDAAVFLVATSAAVAVAVAEELRRRVPDEPRREVIEAALAGSCALVAEDLAGALAFAERYAPEHLLLLVEVPREALEQVRAAGTVFLGPRSSVAFGDYATGANHVLPTGGRARSYSGLGVDDFIRWTTWQEVDGDAAVELARVAAPLAEAEGLPGHAAAARRAAERGEEAAGVGAAEESAPATAPEGAPRPRAPYRSLTRYDPARPPLELELSANTNLWGACPPAVAALRRAGARPTEYPTPYAETLKAAVAGTWGVDPSTVTTGCGSDDLIDSALRAFCEPGAVVAFPAPTFPMADVFARMNDARPRPVPLGADGVLEAEAVDVLCDADVVYICRPNNPTGALPDRAAVERVLSEARGLVLIDEAYGEFAGESMVGSAIASGRGVVLRTLSKAYGLAGLRVGYAIGDPAAVRAIELSRGPYKVGGPAEAAAAAALLEGWSWMNDIVERTVANRERLADDLRDRGLRVLQSAANFLLVGAADDRAGWAGEVKAGLAARGIGVRAFDALPGFGDAIRVTIGPDPYMRRLAASLGEVLEARPAVTG
ncbi:MAG: histidinol dehydrogenase [Gemmatimonadetes bacterium]|nr:histidinol dehydrogenase [Gemmatimonadota bacterium]